MKEVAILAGGCFWCLEAVFTRLEGVLSVTSGYIGGHLDRPDCRSVCEGASGHAEAVRIEFDSARRSYRDLLDVFFAIHDPTTLNRQGNDVGTQYRSAIYCGNAEQERIAREYMAALERDGVFSSPVVTEVVAEGVFFPAEDYHQRYFEQHESQPYCALVVAPKVSKLRQKYAAWLKK